MERLSGTDGSDGSTEGDVVESNVLGKSNQFGEMTGSMSDVERERT